MVAIKNFIDVGDELDKMSKRTGFSVEALGELKFAAEQSGASLDTIEGAAKRMASTIFDAEQGLKTSVDTLDALGLSVEDFTNLDPEAQFQLFADALAGIEDSSTKAALAQDVFGRKGAELLPLFDEGAEGMRALREQAVALGGVMSGEAAASAADFKDAQNELKTALMGIFFAIGEDVLPAITGFVRYLVDNKQNVIDFFNKVKDNAKPFIDAFISGIETIWPLVKGFFTFIFDNKPILIAALLAIGVAIVTALGPVSLSVIAIVALITLIGALRDNWDEIFQEIKRIFTVVTEAILGAYESNLGWLLPAGPLIKAILFLRDNWREIWRVILAIWGRVSGAVFDAYNSKFGWLLPAGPLIKAILFLKDNWREVWNSIQGVIESVARVINRVIDGVKDRVDSVLSAVRRAKEAVNTIGNVASIVTGFASRITGGAHGGTITRGGAIEVGEKGREIVNLPRGATIAPRTGGMGGGDFIVNIYGDVNDAEAFDRKVNEARTRFERRGN